MAGSYITKRALAESLKRLIENEPLSKISIREICDGCHLCRKSFYYHFEDKYALIAWIFDNEFFAEAHGYSDLWDAIEDICGYLYRNRAFCRKVLRDDERRIFTDRLKKIIYEAMAESFGGDVDGREIARLRAEFYSDAFYCSLLRWITEKEPVEHTEFVYRLKSAVDKI